MLAVAAAPAQILDRTVAVVGASPITASEIELQMRLQALFGETSLDLSDEARTAALNRLVEQRLIESDMALAGLPPVEERELGQALDRLRQTRFAGLALDEALGRYGAKERDVREFLRKQLRFSRYVQFRFRAGLRADEAAVTAAYRRRYAGAADAPPLEAVRDELHAQALDEQAERMLDDRVRELRAETNIVYLDPLQPEPEAAP